MRRLLLNLLTMVSLALFVGSGVLWATSYQRVYILSIGRESWPDSSTWASVEGDIRLVQGHWLLHWGREQDDIADADSLMWNHASTPAQFKDRNPGGFFARCSHFDIPTAEPPRIAQPGITDGPSDYLLGVPHEHGFGTLHEARTAPGQTIDGRNAVAPAALAGFVLLLPAIRVVTALRRQARRSADLCPACGYDLRASPERCPECGAVAKTVGAN